MRAGGKGNNSMEFGHGYSSVGNGDPMKDIKCGYTMLYKTVYPCSGRNGIW